MRLQLLNGSSTYGATLPARAQQAMRLIGAKVRNTDLIAAHFKAGDQYSQLAHVVKASNEVRRRIACPSGHPVRVDLCQRLSGSVWYPNQMNKRSDPWHTRSTVSRWAHVMERTGLALAGGRMRIVRHHTRGKGWHRPDRFGCCRPGRCFTGLPVSISDRSASCSTTECTCRSGMDPVPVGMPWNCSGGRNQLSKRAHTRSRRRGKVSACSGAPAN